MTVCYQAERLADVQHELEPLAAMEYAELGQPFPLLPDWQRLCALEAAGKLFLFTVRDGDAMIGANVMLVDTHIHYSGTTVAFNDAIFLHPAHRRGRLGIKLIQYAEIAIKARGVQAIYYHAKPGTALGALLNHIGYGATETVHRKVLPGGNDGC